MVYFEATISQGPIERILYFDLAPLQRAMARCSAAFWEDAFRSMPQKIASCCLAKGPA